MLTTETYAATDRAVTAELRAAIAGPVLAPTDRGYAAEVAAFDLAVRHRPTVAVGATGATDVAAAIDIARRHQLPMTIVGTAHADVAPMVGGVLLTTRRMAGVQIDPAARTARIGAGTAWREVLAAAASWGLAPICGAAPDVGAVGLLLGGGLGPVSRTFGFASDYARSFEVVLPDRGVTHVDEAHLADLFWALRGGKHDLGWSRR